MPLIFSRLAGGVKKIGNRRTAQHNRFPQNLLQHSPQALCLLAAQIHSQPRWVHFGSPETFVGINISYTAEHTLIQKERLDPSAPDVNPFRKFLFAYFQRICAETLKLFGKQRLRQVSDAPEAPRIRVAQFASVIQEQTDMSVFFPGILGGKRRELPGHSQMNEQGRRRGVSIGGDAVRSLHSGKPQQHEFSVALDGFDLASWQVLFQRHGIVDEICLAQGNGEDAAAEDRLAQSARYGFDFRKFRHKKREPSK
jgi:hypothetical protein